MVVDVVVVVVVVVVLAVVVLLAVADVSGDCWGGGMVGGYEGTLLLMMAFFRVSISLLAGFAVVDVSLA